MALATTHLPLRSVADAQGQTFTLTYVPRNVLRTVSDPNGRKFTFTWEGTRLLSVRDIVRSWSRGA